MFSSSFADSVRLIAVLLHSCMERWEQRRTLLEMDDHLLKDIGISRGDALREGRKSFWRGTERARREQWPAGHPRLALASAQPRVTACSGNARP